jgi:hypothetical protein
MKQNEKKTVNRRKAPKYRTLNLQLPYSHGLLLHYGLIRASADGLETLHAMDRLIRQRIIARYRKQGLCVSQILAMLPADGIKKLRHAVRK